jgi:hypothetical protein
MQIHRPTIGRRIREEEDESVSPEIA